MPRSGTGPSDESRQQHQERQIELPMRIREVARIRVRYGYRMIGTLLNRDGWKIGT